MHGSFRVGNTHCSEGISMITSAQSEKFGFCFHLVAEILQSHFQSNFNGDRSGIGKKHIIQISRRKLHKFLRKARSALMTYAAEHHMRHFSDLFSHGIIQFFYIIPVNACPPGRHAVYKFTAVIKYQIIVMRRHHLVCRQRFCQ